MTPEMLNCNLYCHIYMLDDDYGSLIYEQKLAQKKQSCDTISENISSTVYEVVTITVKS
jgi:hypothetical protein